MKRFSVIIALLLVVSVFTACGADKTPDVTETSTSTKVETTELKVEDIEITIDKASLADEDAFVQTMKDYGAEVNDAEDANSYLFVFSKSEHEKLLQDKHDETVKNFKVYEDNQEHYVDVVEYDEDFRNLKIYVDKELYDAAGSATSSIMVAASALSYQLYLEAGQKTNVSLIYSGTEEVITSYTLPMNLSVAK